MSSPQLILALHLPRCPKPPPSCAVMCPPTTAWSSRGQRTTPRCTRSPTEEPGPVVLTQDPLFLFFFFCPFPPTRWRGGGWSLPHCTGSKAIGRSRVGLGASFPAARPSCSGLQPSPEPTGTETLLKLRTPVGSGGARAPISLSHFPERGFLIQGWGPPFPGYLGASHLGVNPSLRGDMWQRPWTLVVMTLGGAAWPPSARDAPAPRVTGPMSAVPCGGGSPTASHPASPPWRLSHLCLPAPPGGRPRRCPPLCFPYPENYPLPKECLQNSTRVRLVSPGVPTISHLRLGGSQQHPGFTPSPSTAAQAHGSFQNTDPSIWLCPAPRPRPLPHPHWPPPHPSLSLLAPGLPLMLT